ncbi:TrbC/VirB2 family protein [Sphingomonas sp. G-3-2-10]|uniref:TrbC/VirB2 family protein n=1 Tax=Sphingomonas sp. G-3-2-10 TaxID=2728838 RepID=UPI00146C6010|nr:TrbC/VirB2 family protein [Sphingomonas sp. G-3-2-10]
MLLSDPPASSAIVAAVQWLEGTLLGTIATTAAVIAVAWIGVMMLTGRVNVRSGATTILGCFILFGATSIVAGIRNTISGDENAMPPVADMSPPVVIPPVQVQNDPYAGASLRRP